MFIFLCFRGLLFVVMMLIEFNVYFLCFRGLLFVVMMLMEFNVYFTLL